MKLLVPEAVADDEKDPEKEDVDENLSKNVEHLHFLQSHLAQTLQLLLIRFLHVPLGWTQWRHVI